MLAAHRYIFKSFIIAFGSMFATLFAVMSIIFFIQISRYTSYIEISFSELAMLYGFLLPKMLTFVVPISFFIGVGISLARLSRDNESLVLFALGHSSSSVARFFLIISIIASAIMLAVSLVAMPISEYKSRQFIEDKKSKISLNIKPSSLGQKFDNWLVFVDDKSQDKYGNIVLYDAQNNRLILSKTGEIRPATSADSAPASGWELALNGGKIYDIKEQRWNVSAFENLLIRAQINSEDIGRFSLKEYWQNHPKDLTIYALIALFCTAGALWAISFGTITYRYEKGNLYTGLMGVLVVYFTLLMSLPLPPIFAIPIIFSITFFSGLGYFIYKIARRY